MYIKIKDDAEIEYPYRKSNFRRDFPDVSIPKNADDSIYAVFGIFPVQETAKPTHDIANENIVEVNPVLTGGVWVQTWQVVEKTQQEKDDYIRSQDALLKKNAERIAVQKTIRLLVKGTDLTNEEKAELVNAYPRWSVPEDVEVGTMRRHESALYECIQAHTTQVDWTPPATPALWNEVVPAGVIGAWSQPAGAHDAYALGALVTHNGQTWVSLVDANVWEPGAVGSETLWAVVE